MRVMSINFNFYLEFLYNRAKFNSKPNEGKKVYFVLRLIGRLTDVFFCLIGLKPIRAKHLNEMLDLL